jgi:phage regulator Rha-like protein
VDVTDSYDQTPAEAQNETLTMSSLEIAELTGKRHADVMRDIHKMIDVLNERKSALVGSYTDKKGEERVCFNLPKDLTLTLITGYSIPLRHKINQRWMELE